MKLTRQQIKNIPKSDLHLHLDGSLRLGTLIELAQEQKIALPSYTEEGLRELVFKEHYASLPEYLQGFAHTVAVMRNPEALERIAYELALDCRFEGVSYIEVRLAPQLHIIRSSDMKWVLAAVARGLERASGEQITGRAALAADRLPFKYGIICCAMRTFVEDMSTYYHNLLGGFPSTPARELVGYASYELARAISKLRDDEGLPIVGFDIAGAEAGHPAKYHSKAYQHCRRNFVGVTVHAGEAYGPESIYDAITECGATRIGHGTHLFACDSIRDPEIKNRPLFCEQLAEYIASTRTTLEVCPTSNLQTNPAFKQLSRHPLGRMLKHELSVAVCTDNRLVSHTTVTDEYMKVMEAFKLNRKALRRIMIAGFKGAFFPGTYAAKRAYVREAIRIFDEAIPDRQMAHSSGEPHE